jgi:hypothetical protein
LDWVRAAIILPVSILVALLVARVAFVKSYAIKDSSKAAAIWAGHPDVMLERGLAEVGERAAAGRPVEPALVQRLLAASAKDPLAPEPFLVRGVQAQLANDRPLALHSFLAARKRNPRAIAARYFLADHYLKAGQTGPGLDEISVLARLVPQSLPNLAPYLAAFARTPGAAPQLKILLEGQPQLEPTLLNALATDAANAQLILDLWSGRGGEEAKPWQGRLLGQLVDAGHYDQARDAWTRFSNISADRGTLFDPLFSTGAPPPFGWTMASGPAGVAEPQGQGRLHILFYGRDDAVLASQLLTLAPGRYQLSMQVNGSSGSLVWRVRCLPSSNEIATIGLDHSGNVAGTFTIAPAGCQAQKLELSGVAPELPEQADVTISRLRLQAEAGQ